ncbi:MAG: 4Fe-4S binding protein [Bacteroidales bacterium]
MRTSALSKIRVALALVVLLISTALFLDIYHLLPTKYVNLILFFQFIPSANKFISVGALAATGFIIVLVLTFLTGRTYCSFLCPLGIFQDVISRIGGKIKKRFRRFGYRKPHTFIRYTILAITLGVTLMSGVYLLTLLDPYSTFGRFMTYFGKPVITLLNNLLAHFLGKADVYTFVHTDLVSYPLEVYIIPVVIFLLVGVMSLVKGRLFCNTICPVGTFLGILSKVSFLRIKFDDAKCTRCGRCAIACKSTCIDFLNKEVDLSRCVGCFNCLNSCPDKALEFGVVQLKKKTEGNSTDESRRKAVVGTTLLLLGMSSVASAQKKTNAPVPKKASTVKEKRTSFVSPPGSTSIRNFTANCTACSLCISECPNNVLVPSYREYGLAGLMQPVMNYHKGFCAYECTRCLEVCPTGAIMPMELEAKKLSQIGKAIFIKDNCIVNTEKTACGACAESCPTKAVHMVPFEGNLVIPETTDDICIGCGHCEFACPTVPYKAIFVNGNPVHAAAKKPVNKQTDLKKPEEFPF